MRFIVNSVSLLRSLQSISGVINAKNTLPILDDFLFELTNDEINTMVSQSVIPSKSYFGGAVPFVFTEQGVSMLSVVMRTSSAIEISVKIIRAFVGIRKFLSENASVFNRLDNIERMELLNYQNNITFLCRTSYNLKYELSKIR